LVKSATLARESTPAALDLVCRSAAVSEVGISSSPSPRYEPIRLRLFCKGSSLNPARPGNNSHAKRES
jgi:hypothetical protein